MRADAAQTAAGGDLAATRFSTHGFDTAHVVCCSCQKCLHMPVTSCSIRFAYAHPFHGPSGTATWAMPAGGCAGVEPWMFPWERRQLRGDGTGLRTWEKLYWGVFVTAISVFLFSRLTGPRKVAGEDPVCCHIHRHVHPRQTS